MTTALTNLASELLEKSAVSHSITWQNAVSVKPVKMSGTIAFAVAGTPADCASLGVSKALFPSIPDVQGLGKPFFNEIPSVSPSYDWVGGISNINDFTLAAEACLPIISATMAEIKKKTYPQNCFLNIDVSTNVANHKGYRLTKQDKSIVKMGWTQVTADAQIEKMSSTMTMETNSSLTSESEAWSTKHEHLFFKGEVTGSQVEDADTDYCNLQEGFITVTPLAALSPAEVDIQAYFKQLLVDVTKCLSSSSSSL